MKKTALYNEHIELNAKMVPFAGYEMPVQYSSVLEEHMAVRENVGMFDVSHMGQFFISGKGAEVLVQKLTTNDISKVKVGQAQYSAMTNAEGGIIDDLITYKLSEEKFLMVVNASNIAKDWEWINSQNDAGTVLKNESDNYSLIAVQGPKATALLQELTTEKLSEIKFYHFTNGEIATIPEVIISATGYTGSGGFELYCKNNDAPKLWQAIMDKGEAYDLKPCGLAARDTLRLEKGYCLYGNDITENNTPLEAGLGWVTKLNTGFVGSSAIQKQKEGVINRKLVAFKLNERGIPRKGYDIKSADGVIIGEVTSGTQSLMLSCGIGLGYVQKTHASQGCKIQIAVRKKNLEATVVKLPFV